MCCNPQVSILRALWIKCTLLPDAQLPWDIHVGRCRLFRKQTISRFLAEREENYVLTTAPPSSICGITASSTSPPRILSSSSTPRRRSSCLLWITSALLTDLSRFGKWALRIERRVMESRIPPLYACTSRSAILWRTRPRRPTPFILKHRPTEVCRGDFFSWIEFTYLNVVFLFVLSAVTLYNWR